MASYEAALQNRDLLLYVLALNCQGQGRPVLFQKQVVATRRYERFDARITVCPVCPTPEHFLGGETVCGVAARKVN